MSHRRRYLVCYDIAEAKRLRHTAHICESYGTRIQFSVFEISLDATMLASLKGELNKVINHDVDQILIVDLGRDDESTPFDVVALGIPYLKKARLTII